MKVIEYIQLFLLAQVAAVPLVEHRSRSKLETHREVDRHRPKYDMKMVDERLQDMASQVSVVASASSTPSGDLNLPEGMSPGEYLTKLFKSMEQRIHQIMSSFNGMANGGGAEPGLLPPVGMPTSINPGGPIMTAPAAASSSSSGANDTYALATTAASTMSGGAIDQTKTTGLFLKGRLNYANTSSTPFFGVLPPAATFPTSPPNTYATSITTFIPVPIGSSTTTPLPAAPTSTSAAEAEEVQRVLHWFFNFLKEFLPRFFNATSGTGRNSERHGHRSG